MSKFHDESYVRIPLLRDEEGEEALSTAPVQFPKTSSISDVRKGNEADESSSTKETTLEMDPGSKRTNEPPSSFLQHNWITAFLLSVVLAWIAWMGIKELLARQSGSPSPVFVLKNCLARNVSDNDMVLSALNQDEWRFATKFCGCPTIQLHRLTMRRLTLRINERQERLVNHQKPHRSPANNSATRYVAPRMIELPLGLGNWMFFIASTYGIARKYGMRYTIFQPSRRENYFPFLDVPKHSKQELFNTSDATVVNKTFTIPTKNWATFDDQLETKLKASAPLNVTLDDYLQVFRYFDDYREDIKRMFLYHATIFDTALGVINRLLEDYQKGRKSEKPSRSPRLVAIHVRRGDIFEQRWASLGHTPATEGYLLRAALYMQTRYHPVVFFVITNDVTYCRTIFKEDNFLFVEHQTEQVDMAVLTLMDHLILSVGSYGWWGAYLSDAKDVFYFKNWPRKGSPMEKGIVPADYFPPTWTAFE